MTAVWRYELLNDFRCFIKYNGQRRSSLVGWGKFFTCHAIHSMRDATQYSSCLTKHTLFASAPFYKQIFFCMLILFWNVGYLLYFHVFIRLMYCLPKVCCHFFSDPEPEPKTSVSCLFRDEPLIFERGGWRRAWSIFWGMKFLFSP